MIKINILIPINMNTIFINIIAAVLLCFLSVACDEHLDSTRIDSSVEIVLEWGDSGQVPDLTDATLTFRNINTGAVSVLPLGSGMISIESGLYDISLHAKAVMPNGVSTEIKAQTQSATISGENCRITLKPFYMGVNDDFIISEVFFTGTLQPSGNQYYGDDYIKLYNNTDHLLYADGLTIFESKFLTTDKYEYTPDIMDQAMTVHALYTIPGSGHDHPVQPGEFLLIADTGIDHKVINPNSFDLSGADFEWYDVSTKPAHMDIDSPTVPNLDKWYCYTLSFWVLHNRGFKAYGIARIPVDKSQYLKDYWYSYDYTIVVPAGSFPMSQSAYRLPNEWIVDVVNCSVQAEYEWNVCHPSLDMGWTHCGTIDHDKSRYFHSVRRKLAGFSESGYPIYQDTNNSSEDFNSFVVPSEIEIQQTAMDIYGTKCGNRTYDGVVPVTDTRK